MDTIMEEIEDCNPQPRGTDQQSLRKQLGGPTGRRLNSTSTMMVGDTVSRPNNELTIIAVAEKLHGYIRDSSGGNAANVHRSPKKDERTKKVKSINSENNPPQHNDDPTTIPSGELEADVPSIDQIARYLRQIFRTAQCAVDCIIVCLIYIERLMQTSGLQLTIRNWRSLIAIAMLLASKVQDDYSMVNSDFAVFLPFSVEQINTWERQFLAGIKYDVRVSAGHYTKYYFDLREKAIRSFAHELVSEDVPALDVPKAERLEVLSSKQQRRLDEMRGMNSGKGSKMRRAVSDQYCPSSLQQQGEAGLPDAPSLAGHAHGGNFVVD